MDKTHYKKPSQFRAYVSLLWYSFRAMTRNPATFAFSFLFPIVFISIFGLIGGGSQQINLGVTRDSNQENTVIETLEKQEFLQIKRSDEQSLQTELEQGRIVAIVDIEEGGEEDFTVHLTLSTAFPQETAAVNSLVTSIVDKTNLRLAGATDPPITVVNEEIEGREPRYIDFAVPGQIGFALLSTAIFGTVFGLIYLKKALVLKRMFATPTRAMTILLAQGSSRLIMVLLQTVIIIGFAVFIFGFYLPNGWITFAQMMLVSAFGLVAFLGFGYFIAGLMNDENAASPLTNLVTLPQFLLSGTFFPIDALPSWLQPIASNLPLSYFNEAIRKLTTEGAPLTDVSWYLLGLALWGAAMYILAAKTFKWQ